MGKVPPTPSTPTSLRTSQTSFWRLRLGCHQIFTQPWPLKSSPSCWTQLARLLFATPNNVCWKGCGHSQLVTLGSGVNPQVLRLGNTVSAILNRESGDSESCDSNRAIPRLLSLIFLSLLCWNSLIFSFPRNSLFFQRFPLLSQGFRGSLRITNPCFFGSFPCRFQKKARKGNQGWALIRYDSDGDSESIFRDSTLLRFGSVFCFSLREVLARNRAIRDSWFCAAKLRCDRNFMMRAVSLSRGWSALAYASEELKTDEEILATADWGTPPEGSKMSGRVRRPLLEDALSTN